MKASVEAGEYQCTPGERSRARIDQALSLEAVRAYRAK